MTTRLDLTLRRCPVDGYGHASPAQIRARLSHPVIDADGHWLEYGPVVSEQLRRIGGDRAAEGFLSIRRHDRESLSMSVAERRRRRIPQEAFWSSPAKNTRDRATAMLPRLLYERLGELGPDFAGPYPTAGRPAPPHPPPQRRPGPLPALDAPPP